MRKRRIRFGLGSWMIGVTGLCAGAAVAILVVKARERREREMCISNLRQIDGAKDQFVIGTFGPGDIFTIEPNNIAPYIKGFSNCLCPMAKGTNRTFENSYSINAFTAAPTCKIGHGNHNHRLDYAGP